jgi:hypothetical protein
MVKHTTHHKMNTQQCLLTASVIHNGKLIGQKGEMVTLLGSIDPNTRTGLVRFQSGDELSIYQWYLRVIANANSK